MSLSRVKTWSAGEVLTAADLNAEFNNILNNPVDLWSPAGKAVDMNGFELILDADADTSFTSDTDDQLDLRLGGTDLFRWKTVSSAVNGVDFFGAATGSGPSIVAFGSDTNIPVTVSGKGTGRVMLGQATSTDVQLVADQPVTDSSGNEFIKFSKTSSAVNEVTVANAATGNGPTLSATGGDTDVDLNFAAKGSGGVKIGGSAVVTLAATQTLTNKTLTSPTVNTPTITAAVISTASSSLKPLVKDHGTKATNYTLQIDEADMHLVTFSAAATLTIASANTNDKAVVIVKNGGNAITLSGIDTDSPTLTNGASKQDFLGIVKSFGRITCIATALDKATS